MLKNYILMNQNTKVLKFEYDSELNVITNILENYSIKYAPLNIKNIEETKRRIELNNWFNDRGIPIYRDNAKEIIEAFGINNVKELINKDYGLSVSDQYWFKLENEDIKWEEINYFQRDYGSINFTNATYGSGASKYLNQTINNKPDKTPNNTSNGQLKKVWVKRDNENYLYKGAGTIHNFEPINEVLASLMCEILDVPHVTYTLDVIKGNRQNTLVSVCKCIINKDEEILPAYTILTEEKEKVQKTINDYHIYLKILNENNVPNAEEYLQKMFMLDYILLNEDRHLNNFGVIRDVKTLEWKRICPIFDTGRSMNTNVTTSYWNFKEGEIKCFTNELISSKNLEPLFTIKIKEEQIEKLKKLQEKYKEMLEKYSEYTKLSKEEIQMLTEGYRQRIEVFEKIMKEKNKIL